MLPRKLHLEQINRFHDEFEILNKQIDTETDKDKKYDLLFKFMKFTRLWPEIDDSIEAIKYKLDVIERDDK